MASERTLSQEIEVELQAKKKRLQNLQQERTKLLGFIESLKDQEAVLEQLNTSARRAQNERHVEMTGLTISEQHAKALNDLDKVEEELDAVNGAINLIGHS